VIEADFVGDPEADQQGDGHAGAKPNDINDGIDLILRQVAPGDEEIIFEHGFYFICG
jgi:hypothetical protein